MATTTAAVAGSTGPFTVVPRPQIGIERLPVQRRASNEPKEAMNCKSCRKRKIKCNRLKPTCEACQVFKCSCIYDAVPKKRGPKTELLETLLKRVNGLEKRLQDKEGLGPTDETSIDAAVDSTNGTKNRDEEEGSRLESAAHQQDSTLQLPIQPTPEQTNHRTMETEPTSFTDALLDTYFTRLHGKPFYILDEAATRQRIRGGLLPRFLCNAVYALSVRYASHLCGGQNAAVMQSMNYAAQSRSEIDVDEPSIDHLQALLLLSMATFQFGRGKTSYMLLSHAVSMAFALNLHRELPTDLRIASNEREGRRKLFWTCYLMDRLTPSGSKRPALISDESIYLRLPAWVSSRSHLQMDGNYFPNGSSLSYATGISHAGQGSGAMLVEVVRILGVTNRYLAAGGVKGDSHFPWHAQSTLSKIRSDLDDWAASTQDAFNSLDALFGQSDSSTLVLSKLIYHLVHCLIYRPFLPLDLAELSGTDQHQSWQIKATNLCFLHANAIAELVEIGRNTSISDWPSFVGYCICTAGTIHIHGINFISSQEGEVFNNSSDFLAREMVQLADLRYSCAGVQHHWQTLQYIYTSHTGLIESLATNPIRFSPVFQMEDFLDRYAGSYIDGAYLTFNDIDPTNFEDPMAFGKAAMWSTKEKRPSLPNPVPSIVTTKSQQETVIRPAKKRRTTSDSILQSTINLGTSITQGTNERRATLSGYVSPVYEEILPLNDESDTNNDQSQNDGLLQAQNQSAASPSFSFSFSPLPQVTELEQGSKNRQWDTFYGVEGLTYGSPSGFSHRTESAQTDPDKDPFLGFLEQLAHDDTLGDDGPKDLDFFLKGDG